MTDRDQNSADFATALTRLDLQPGQPASAPTVLDATPARRDSAPTVFDRGRPNHSVPTVLDAPAREPGPGHRQLPTSLRSRYQILRQFPPAGAEADLFLVERVDSVEGEQRIVKLYRFGVTPKVDVLTKVRDGNPQHLVRIFEFGESDDQWYEVMEFVAQGSLRQVKHDRRLPPINVLDLVRELWIGLEHLHQFGIIHRDLKPENVLVRELMPLDLVITDFGISSLSDLSQHFTTANRTVRYAAPEALSGVIGHAVDYWSLGMIVAEATLDRHPLADLIDERAVIHWLTTRPIDLSGIADERIRTLCRGLLLRDPSRRWGSAEIKRWLNGDSTLAAPPEETWAVPASAATSEGRAATPYAIGADECWTAPELGIALANNWQIALKDFGRGLLHKWCEKELHSVALDRLFMDLEESTADPNDKLLDLILHLCRDIPPVYRGENLASNAAIADVLKRASSVSEGEEAKRARTVVKQVRKGLLDRFQLQEGSEVSAFRDRYRTLSKAYDEGYMPGFGPATLHTDIEQGGIAYPKSVEMTAEAKNILEVAIVLEPEHGERIRTEAKAFASSTEFRFWFHECVERGMEPSVPIWDAVLLKEHLALARHWYAEACKRIWTPRLSEPYLAPAWRALVEARFDRAWEVAAEIDSCLATCANGPRAQTDLVAALGLGADSIDGSPEGRQELITALAKAREGLDQPLRDWIEEVRRQADVDVVEGFRRLADIALDRQVRALVHRHVQQAPGGSAPGSHRPVRWSLIGLLTNALCGLEARGQAIGRLLTVCGMTPGGRAWLAKARQQLCLRITTAMDSAQAFAMLKGLLRGGATFEELLDRLAQQATKYPQAASSLLGEVAPLLRPFSDKPPQDSALPAFEMLTDLIMDLRLQSTLISHGNSVYSVAFSPDSRLIASASRDNTVRLWDTNTRTLLRTLEGHDSSVYSVAFSPDGRLVASGSDDNTVRLWDAISGTVLQTLQGHAGLVYSVAFSPDGCLIASGSGDRTVRLWDVSAGNLRGTLGGHAGSVHSVAFSSDGRLIASGCGDKTIRLWDATTRTLMWTLEGHTECVSSVAFSPDSRHIASGSFDKTVRLWDATTGTLLRTLEGHTGVVESVAFSSDSCLVASGGRDRTVRLWHATTGTLPRTLEGHTGSVQSVAFSPDGRVIASGSKDKTVSLNRVHGELQTSAAVTPLPPSSSNETAVAASDSDWVARVELLSNRLLTLMRLTRDWTPNAIPIPAPRSRPETDPRETARASADSSNPPQGLGDQRGEEAPAKGKGWHDGIVTSVIFQILIIAPLGLLLLGQRQSAPRREPAPPAAAAPVMPAHAATAPATPARSPSSAPINPAPAPTTLPPVSPSTAPDRLDEKFKSLAALFDIENTVAAINEMLSGAASLDSQLVDLAAAKIARLEKPPRGNRVVARALNAKGLEVLPSDPMAAVGIFHDAAESDPADAEVLGNLAFAYLKAGMPSDARDAAVVSLALTPRRASSWGTFALAAVALGEPEELSIAAFHNAYRYAGNPEKSVEYLTGLASDDPDPRVRAFAERTLPTLTRVEHIDPVNYAQ